MAKTFEKSCEFFLEMVANKDADKREIEAIRCCFYSGADAILRLLSEIQKSSATKEEMSFGFKGIQDEIHRYFCMHEIKKGGKEH